MESVTEGPLVSVLITAYNRQEFISEAIESVLASSYPHFELIIVDDCSSDATVNIARTYEENDRRIKVYVNGHNLGDYFNRNKAASYASGKYLKYVDSDDKIYPASLDIMVNAMEQYPEASFGVSSRTETITSCLSPHDAYYCHFLKRGLFDYGPTAVIIRRESFEKYGPFIGVRNISDLDLWLTLAATAPVLELPKGLVFWRQHDQQEINIAAHIYYEYSLPITEKHLLSAACPLSKTEVARIIRLHRKALVKSIFRYAVKERKPAELVRLWKLNHLKLRDLV